MLGANDDIISTASLVVGVAAAATAPGEVMVAGVAGMVAGQIAIFLPHQITRRGGTGIPMAAATAAFGGARDLIGRRRRAKQQSFREIKA